MQSRSFLFLQGVATPFFGRLAETVESHGHDVRRINFCGGDRFYWNGLPSWDFTDPQDSLTDFLDHKFNSHKFTDVILFGDKRPIHQKAIKVARKHDSRVHVFEEGYIRPNWVTLEEGGVNGNSNLPSDPNWYLEHSSTLPNYDDGKSVGTSFRSRVIHDIKYNLANTLDSKRFKHFLSHRPEKISAEYKGWIKRYFITPVSRHKAKLITHNLIRHQKSFFILPLQLNSDTQILLRSPYSSMENVLKKVIPSFAKYARENEILLIKIHPLDTGLVNYKNIVNKFVREYDLADRLMLVDGGHLPTLLGNAKGVITVNSTTGLQAIFHKCPVKCLGDAIYNMKGLTFQGELNDFWSNPSPPDNMLYKAHRNAVIHFTQVNGGFYNNRGMEMLVKNSIGKILTEKSRNYLL